MKPIFVLASPGSLHRKNNPLHMLMDELSHYELWVMLLTYTSRFSRSVWQTTSRYPVSTALWDTSRMNRYTAGCGGLSWGQKSSTLTLLNHFHFFCVNSVTVVLYVKAVTMYSDGAMNSMVAFWTSGLLWGVPYDLLTGLYMNSSGTERKKPVPLTRHSTYYSSEMCNYRYHTAFNPKTSCIYSNWV